MACEHAFPVRVYKHCLPRAVVVCIALKLLKVFFPKKEKNGMRSGVEEVFVKLITDS